ncbi:MAG: tRNA (N(6)-L-threonylcarbamoyladenosine(37)-C(2))-methylthiotransferase MtaB [Roseburia sp.]|nr:tRNA (N(6)-L-threonylcarbamoyladenosine(37)-C(2))-methylthiotransferase MtaB [Roseburia sp.]
MKTVAFHNLGCKVNAYEADAMLQALRENGYRVVPFEEKADIYIVNTCTVTNIADRKSRQMLHRARKTNPQAVVVAVGCYVQTDTAAVAEDDAVDLLIGNNRKRDLVQILEAYMAGEAPEGVIDIHHTNEYEEMRLTGPQEHTRAYIKIQDGCNQFCTYCMIPYARGRVRSRKKSDVLEEIGGLAALGYREFVLTGIHISSYGTDFGAETGEDRGLLSLIRETDAIAGVERIRLGSLEPRIVTETFARELAKLRHICPHFHLSLQSGCAETLRRMNRRYTPEQYAQSVSFLREAFSHPAITTDVIAGFPGETEEEFAQTARFVEDIHFFEMHIFKYSKRRGTKAAAMDGQLSEQVKAQRSARLQQIEERASREFRDFYIGKETETLPEEKKRIAGRDYWVGHTREYVKTAVCAQAGENLSNRPIRGIPEGYLTKEILLMKRIY